MSILFANSVISKTLLKSSHKTSHGLSCRLFSKKGKGVVLGLYQKEGKDREAALTTEGKNLDDLTGGSISKLITQMRMSGKLGRGKIFNNIHPEYPTVAVVGLGREGVGFNELEMLDQGMENVRVAAGVGAKALLAQGVYEIHLDTMDYPEQAAEGAGLAVWRYEEFKRKDERKAQPILEPFGLSKGDAWARGIFKADAQNLARRLSDTPSNHMTPTLFAKETADALCSCGITVEIRTLEWIEQQRINSFMMVAKGSCEPPVLMELNYCGADPIEKPVLLLGKGLTFNSGGINLRPCKGMDEYRGSMAGAAVVVASMRAAAALSLPINLTAIIPLCENMPSGMAAKPGDVVTLLNGKSLAIRDLDLAGVAVLADPLLYGQFTYNPRLVIDVATLGVGVKKALGGGATGIFSNSHFIFKEFLRAGSLTGDRMWRLPLWKFYKKLVTCDMSYDLSNDGYGPASSCLAAAVLHELVPCSDWVHLDIRGVGLTTKFGTVPYLAKPHMTGRPTRTVVQFLYQLACPERDCPGKQQKKDSQKKESQKKESTPKSN